MTYSLLQPPRPLSALGYWESQLPGFTHIVGYSGLGHFFLCNDETGEYAVCYPYRRAYKNYGSFDSIAAFEATILLDPAFMEHVLKPEHQLAIRKRVGALQADEVYIAEPYPFLGGSEEPGSYGKGNFWTFAELVGISHGFDETA